MRRKKDVLMWSGGLDSTIAYFYLGKPRTVFVDLGHRYANIERLTTATLAKELDMDYVVDTRLFLGDMEKEDAEIPMRNMFLAMVGALYGDNVYMVFQKGEQSLPDRSIRFVKGASRLLSYLNSRTVEVCNVFPHLTKAQMISWYRSKGYSVDILYETVSCFSEDESEIPCGRCKACFRRWIAFECNHLPVGFNNDITKWDGIQEYVKKMKAGEYDQQRVKETKIVLERYGLWK